MRKKLSLSEVILIIKTLYIKNKMMWAILTEIVNIKNNSVNKNKIK